MASRQVRFSEFAGQREEHSSRRALSVAEMVVVYGLIEAALWSETAWRIRWSIVALLVVVAIGLYRRELWPRLGVGTGDFWRSMTLVPLAVASSAVLLFCGWWAGTLHMLYGPHFWPVAVTAYLLWAVQQQYLLQSFFLTRFEDLLGNQRRAVVVAALVFALAHVPNPILMIVTFAMALVFCAWFQRHRNIYPLALAHAMLGLSLAASLPEPLLHRMRVGIGYLHYVAR